MGIWPRLPAERGEVRNTSTFPTPAGVSGSQNQLAGEGWHANAVYLNQRRRQRKAKRKRHTLTGDQPDPAAEPRGFKGRYDDQHASACTHMGDCGRSINDGARVDARQVPTDEPMEATGTKYRGLSKLSLLCASGGGGGDFVNGTGAHSLAGYCNYIYTQMFSNGRQRVSQSRQWV